MVCAKKTDSGIKQSGRVGIGVGFDLNFEGSYFGHIIGNIICNTANPFGGDQFCGAFDQLCAGPALRLGIHTCTTQKCRGVNMGMGTNG